MKALLRKKRHHPARIVYAAVPFVRKAGLKPVVTAVCLAMETSSAAINGHGEASVRRALLSLDRACTCGKRHQARETQGDPLPDLVPGGKS